MDGNALTAKYRERERGVVLTDIINKMKEHGVTLQDIEQYEAVNVTEMRQKLLRIRKTQALKDTADGRRRRQATI